MTSFVIESNHIFSAQSIANGQITPNQKSTRLQILFNHTDTTQFLGNVNGFELELSMISSQGAAEPMIMTATTTQVTDFWTHELLGMLAVHTDVVTSVVTRDRTSYAVSTSGNIRADPNVQALLQFLTPANSSTPLQRRRALLGADVPSAPFPSQRPLTSQEQEMFARTRSRHDKFFSTPLSVQENSRILVHPEHVKRVERQAMKVRLAAQRFAEAFEKSHGAGARRLLQTAQQTVPGLFNYQTACPPNSQLQLDTGCLPQPAISGAVVTDAQTFLANVGQVINGPGIYGQGSFTDQERQSLNSLNAVTKSEINSTVADAATINQFLNVSGSQAAARLANQQNANAALLANQLANQNMTLLAGNQTNWIVNQALQDNAGLETMIVNFQNQGDPFANATASALATVQMELAQFENVYTVLYQQFQGSQGLLNLVHAANQQQTTLEPVTNALTSNEHRIKNDLVTANYVPIRSTRSPAPQGLGFVPLSNLNLGFAYRQRIQATTWQSQQSSVLSSNLYVDVDMQNVPNYRSQTLYDSLISGAGTGTQPIFYAHMDVPTFFCDNSVLLADKRKIYTFYDPMVAIGPYGCTPFVNCTCWVTTQRERCSTTAMYTTSNVPVVRNHIYDSSGCKSSGETNSWYGADGTDPALAATTQPAHAVLTSVTDVMAELQRICIRSLQLSDQTTQVPTGPYAPHFVTVDFAQQNAPVNGISGQQQVPNNWTYCGTAPQVMMDQSYILGTATLPYLFISGVKMALEGLLGQIGPAWSQDVNGGSDSGVSTSYSPYFTPNPATSSGSGFQEKWIRRIGYTSSWAVPIYHMHRLSTIQTMQLDFRRPNSSAIVYTITLGSGQIQDVTSFFNQNALFQFDDFTFVGFLNCLRDPLGCRSPDLKVLADGTNHGFDVPSVAMPFSNVTELNEGTLAYYADLRCSDGTSQFCACPYSLFALTLDPRCNQSAPQYTFQSPPPVWGMDDFEDYYGQPFNPDNMADSLFQYTMPVVQNVNTGELDCAPLSGTSPDAAGYIQGTLCQWLSTSSPYGLDPGFPAVMDETEIIRADRRQWYSQVTIDVPAILIAALGETITTCPPQPQMYFRSTAGAWVSLYINNGYNVALNMTVTFTSSVCANTANVSVPETFTIAPAPAFHLVDLPFCDSMTMVVQSWNPSINALQNCWTWTGNATQVFSDENRLEGPTGVTLDTENSSLTTTSPVVQAAVSEIVGNSDFDYQVSLFTTLMFFLYNTAGQVSTMHSMAQYIITQTPPADVNASSMTMNASTAIGLGVLHNTLLDYTSQNAAQVAALLATQAADNNVQAGLNANVVTDLQAEMEVIANATQIYAGVQAGLATNIAIVALNSPGQQSRLATMQTLAAKLQDQTNRQQLAYDGVRWYPPADPTGPPPAPMPWGLVLGHADLAGIDDNGWMGFINFCAAVGEDIFAVLAFIFGLIFNPNCPFGISFFCLLSDIFHYLLVIFVVIVAIVAAVVFYKCYQMSKNNKSASQTSTHARPVQYRHTPAETQSFLSTSVVVAPKTPLAAAPSKSKHTIPTKPHRHKTTVSSLQYYKPKSKTGGQQNV